MHHYRNMTNPTETPSFETSFKSAEQCERAGQSVRAEALCLQALEAEPGQPQATLLAARLATARKNFRLAAQLLQQGFDRHRQDTELAIQLALALATTGELLDAVRTLQHAVAARPEAHHAWLFLSVLLDKVGDGPGALKAAYQAVTRAQRSGEWLDEASTQTELLPLVIQVIERVRLGRRELFLGSFAELRARHGNAELVRMDRALSLYLNEIEVAPPSAHQRPIFLYFPDLPSTAYHDAALQPWSRRLTEAFPDIRAEALAVLEADRQALPDFITTADRTGQDEHLAGASAAPRWQAFFFYRRGRRFDANHARCSVTSSVLESADLCRIADQAPEICFSVLGPGTHIKPHHGVTNTRLVMHLPLIVPSDCALNVFGGGLHAWTEGELVMFDDTFLHEAWNRSAHTRVVLLMDCWNPHLTAVERVACTQLIEMISSLKPRTQAGPTAK